MAIRIPFKASLCLGFLILIICDPLRANASRPLPAIAHISPPIGIAAPRNTIVFIDFIAGWPGWYFDATNKASLKDAEITVRSISTKSDIRLKRFDHQQGKHGIVQLKPDQLLAVGDYEIVLQYKNKSTTIGEFRIGNFLDEKAPHFDQKPFAYYISIFSFLNELSKKDLCGYFDANMDPDEPYDPEEMTGEPTILAEKTAASDDKTPKNLITYAIWLQSAKKSIDYQQTPTFYIIPSKLPFFFPKYVGGFYVPMRRRLPNGCADLAEAGLDPLNLRIGIRPMDLAGNLGPGWESVIPENWQPKPEKPSNAPIMLSHSRIPKFTRAELPALDHFSQAIKRSVDARRFNLAFEQCMFAWSLVGIMPAACRAIPQHVEWDYRNFLW